MKLAWLTWISIFFLLFDLIFQLYSSILDLLEIEFREFFYLFSMTLS
jgi:hypothetical protein